MISVVPNSEKIVAARFKYKYLEVIAVKQHYDDEQLPDESDLVYPGG